MKKRIISILVSLILIALMCAPLFARAQTKDGEGEATLLQEGEYDIEEAPEVKFFEKLITNERTPAQQAAYDALLNVESSIFLGNYNIPVDDLSAFYSDVINDNADLFYVSSSYRYNYYPSTNTVAYVTPYYAMDTQEIENAKEEFDSGVAKALSTVDDSMTDLQKAVTLHDYICDLAIYPVLMNEEDEGYSEEYADKDLYHSAYGFFHNNVIVCAGYTLAYSYLLRQVGVDSNYVASEGMTHAWNKVKIDGNWYNADLTYDDSLANAGVNIRGTFRHAFFLKSDSYFESSSGAYHFDGVTYDDCTSANTDYDNAFFNNVDTMIYTVNGDFYYIKPDESNLRNAKLVRRSGETESDISSFSSTYGTYTSNNQDSSGQWHQLSFTDTIVRLLYLDNRFYVTSSKYIYGVLLSGTKYTVKTTDSLIFGLGVNGGKNLVYTPYSNTNDGTLVELSKREYFENYISTQENSVYNIYPDINLDGYINAKDFAYIIS